MSTSDSGKALSTSSKRKDPAWKYIELVDPKNTCNTICKFCNQRYSGGIYRAKQHIVGGHGNAKACDKVPDHVKEEIRNYMDNKEGARGQVILGKQIQQPRRMGMGSRKLDNNKLEFAEEGFIRRYGRFLRNIQWRQIGILFASSDEIGEATWSTVIERLSETEIEIRCHRTNWTTDVGYLMLTWIRVNLQEGRLRRIRLQLFKNWPGRGVVLHLGLGRGRTVDEDVDLLEGQLMRMCLALQETKWMTKKLSLMMRGLRLMMWKVSECLSEGRDVVMPVLEVRELLCTVDHVETVREKLQQEEQNLEFFIRSITSPRMMRKFVKHHAHEPGTSGSFPEGQIVKYGHGLRSHTMDTDPAPDKGLPSYPLQDTTGDNPVFGPENVPSGQPQLTLPEDLANEKSVQGFPLLATENIAPEVAIGSMGFETGAGMSICSAESWSNGSYYDMSEFGGLLDVWDIGQGGSSGNEKRPDVEAEAIVQESLSAPQQAEGCPSIGAIDPHLKGKGAADPQPQLTLPEDSAKEKSVQVFPLLATENIAPCVAIGSMGFETGTGMSISNTQLWSNGSNYDMSELGGLSDVRDIGLGGSSAIEKSPDEDFLFSTI